MPAARPRSTIEGLCAWVSIMPGPVSDLCREDVGHEECNCQGARFLMLSVQTFVTRDTSMRHTGQAWRRHASHIRTSLAPSRLTYQDKPGTTKEAQDTGVVSTIGQQGKPGTTE